MPTAADDVPSRPRVPASRGAAAMPAWRRFRLAHALSLSFVAAWALLDVVANLRYPGREPKLWYLIPSLDVVLVLLAFAALGQRGRAVPRGAHAALVALFVVVRVLRFGDGIKGKYLNRPFNLYLDVPLAPELVRLMNVTLTPLTFAAAIAIAVLGVVLLALGLRWAFRTAARALEERGPRALLYSVVALSLAASPFHRPESKYEPLFTGAFGASGVARLYEEARFLLEVSGYRTERVAEIDRVERAIASEPSDLALLRGTHVLSFLIESYGETVLERPDFVERITPVYADFERAIRARGFAVASTLLDSPTYGGSSWLAHATIATGVRVADQLHYDLLETRQLPTMAGFFQRAGHRTVRVEPGTIRRSSHGAFGGFDARYASWDFGYQGPRFGWATMPDEYVVELVHRKEIAPATRPRFIEYALVSSHAPWTEQPPIVADAASLGDGSIYRRLPKVRYDVGWSNLEDGAAAYIRSICYDLEILQRYLTDRIEDGSLVLILGDHQPPVEVAQNRAAAGVPIHVISRNQGLVAPFLRRGYTPSMRPVRNAPRAGLETLLSTLLSEFSEGEVKRPR